jgi:GSH-dependent disulfide-bond oxidoreductase
MIDLYAAGTSNGMRARIALEECGLPYNFHPINLDKGENKTPQFLAMNPVGQIPVIVDQEGPGGKPVTISQSSAILLYCAEKSGKHLPKPADRPAFLEALMRASTDITPTLGAIFNSSKVKPEPHGPTVGMFKDFWKRYLKVWDDVFAGRKYAAGSDFTIADISLYAGYVRMSKAIPELVEGFPNVARWAQEVGARPATQRALKF